MRHTRSFYNLGVRIVVEYNGLSWSIDLLFQGFCGGCEMYYDYDEYGIVMCGEEVMEGVDRCPKTAR